MPNNTKNLLNPTLTAHFHARAPSTITMICHIVESHKGNLVAAARELKISVETLRRWAKVEKKIAAAVKRGRIEAIKSSTALK